ncbi:MAG TPA: hypothetical protein VK060_16465 [Ruania sp.]|nr:hypothetical protein [Ruania sp.]
MRGGVQLAGHNSTRDADRRGDARLGNTPAVRRDSSIDPRLLETYETDGDLDIPVPPSGIPGEHAEEAVRTLLNKA